MEPNIFLSIPSYDGKISTGFLPAFYAWVKEHIITVHVVLHSPLDCARNAAIDEFLKRKEHTHFLGLDTDITPTKESLSRLLAAKKDCISPLMFTLKRSGILGVVDSKNCIIPVPLILRRNGKGAFKYITDATGIAEVDILPGGMYLVKRKVIEKVGLPAFSYRYTNTGTYRFGTDEGFSRRAQKAGFKLYIDTDTICEQTLDIGASDFYRTLLTYFSHGAESNEEKTA